MKPGTSTSASPRTASSPASPVRLALLLGFTIFAAEVFVMAVISLVPPMSRLVEAAADAGILLLVLAPALFFFVLTPLRNQIRAYEATELKLIQSQATLEAAVAERTSDLLAANREATRSLEEIEQSNRESLVLEELSELLQTCRSVAEAELLLSRLGEKLFPSSSGSIYLYRASRNAVEAAARWGPGESVCLPSFPPEDCWALRLGRRHSSGDGFSDIPCKHFHGAPPRRSLCVPMMAHGEATGVLVLNEWAPAESPQDGSALRITRLARRAAEQIALAVANIQLRERLRDQAIRDPLTALYNRRYFEETAERELRRASRAGETASILALDIDHFKRFNDLFGHDLGDIVLKRFGQLLSSSLRPSDIACRMGGEEFFLLLPGVQPGEVLDRAAQLCSAVSAMEITHRGEPLQSVTVSCGIAHFPLHATQLDELRNAADRALYRAKQNGRNRVEVAD